MLFLLAEVNIHTGGVGRFTPGAFACHSRIYIYLFILQVDFNNPALPLFLAAGALDIGCTQLGQYNNDFAALLSIIERARENAYRAVNRELISMYWEVGQQVSEKVCDGGWGKSVVKEFSAFVQHSYVGIRGFSPQNIWRMKQFFETYSGNEKLSTLSREISWSNNVLIMMAAKTDVEREFYIALARKYNYSARELERQINSLLYERTMISDEKNKRIINCTCRIRPCWKANCASLPKSPKRKIWKTKMNSPRM
ncbi:MAG: DUF1016 N-terminal domain-containing protein [Firmicutes bacterium]|nr:DUF1016 N-terminal domain-containing protein [Bacillota bacterium]